MRVAYTEDALQVLIHDFNYEIVNFAERGGITLVKHSGSRRRSVNLPYGEPSIPEDVLHYVLQHADFTMDQFWEAHDRYVGNDK